MARRKDHTPKELKGLILQSARKIIDSKGLNGLTARALANAIGYTPGTIYNFYRDMDALVTDINHATLEQLYRFCNERTQGLPLDFSKVRALAYAYVDFAHDNRRAWETLFAGTRDGSHKSRLPAYYRQALLNLFEFIETILRECLQIPAGEAAKMARLLWAAMHGITVLTLDGRLNLIGVGQPHEMIDDLLQRYLFQYQ
ncbi:MAG: TetR-like C-terminal domain-containing protein [Alphaproteobacteria bacterium]|nr:TetR-like C-terminal domain-containing protein [Alphaproteobacteria bacterium]